MPISERTSALLHAVLGRYGIVRADLHDIRSGRVNKHWRVEADNCTYALRRYTEFRSLEAVRYEHSILRYVQAKGWPVAPPLSSRDTNTVVEVEGRFYSLFPFLSGRPATQNAGLAHQKGRLLAQLHDDLASWEAPGQRDGFGRAWELDLYVSANGSFRALNDLLIEFGHGQPDLARVFRAQKYAMLRELSRLGFGELPLTPCHFDFHGDNLLFQRGQLSGLLDFDLVHVDSRVADIASCIFLDCYAPPAYNQISPGLASQFVAGYVEHTRLSDDELTLVVPLVRAAILGLIVWRLGCWARGADL